MNNSVMKCCICNNENTGRFITISGNKYHLICIENLQQENKRLKEAIKNTYDSSQDIMGELSKENKDLHNKIDKAIRYIKKNKHYIDIEDMNLYLYEDDMNKVIEILKDSDVDDRQTVRNN